jgi:RNA polymerase sigma factor (sigma-70 family)
MFGRAKETSFEAVIMPHFDSAYNLARWIVRDAALAEDVVQDALVRAVKYYVSFRGDNPRAWLMRIVRNTAYTTLASRKQERQTIFDDHTPTDGDKALAVADERSDLEARLFEREEKAYLTRLVSELPTELRECLILREIEELSYKEIASIVEVPIGTVMSRLWRARQVLISRVEDGRARA